MLCSYFNPATASQLMNNAVNGTSTFNHSGNNNTTNTNNNNNNGTGDTNQTTRETGIIEKLLVKHFHTFPNYSLTFEYLRKKKNKFFGFSSIHMVSFSVASGKPDYFSIFLSSVEQLNI